MQRPVAPSLQAPPPGGAPIPEAISAPLDDLWMRAVGIPAFGISIPILAGLYGEIGPGEGRFWLGQALFVFLAWGVWMGNRWLLFKQREHVSWFGEPIQKLILLVAAATFYTAPVTVGLLWLWYRVASLPTDWGAIQTVALANVICVLFVTHVYETVFLIQERRGDLLRVSRLERARAEAELHALRAQVDPHFLFNCLNTLGALIEGDPPRAREFNASLANVYRYLLRNRERDLVQLSDELAFLRSYIRLLEIRFGDGFTCEIRGLEGVDPDRSLIPPTALQVLLENAVKHNRFGRAQPLAVALQVEPRAIVVTNPRRPRPLRLPSAGVGLSNLGERYRLATGEDIEIWGEGPDFTVRLPLLGVG